MMVLLYANSLAYDWAERRYLEGRTNLRPMEHDAMSRLPA